MSLRHQILEKYALPEWAVVFEMSNATGLEMTRRADAVAFNCWPSKHGLRIGFEFKASRSDFIKELSDPDKRKWLEEHFHETYFVFTDPSIARIDEVPEGWGLLVSQNYKGGQKLIRKKVARSREPTPLADLMWLSAIRAFAQESQRIHNTMWRVEGKEGKMTKAEMEHYISSQIDAERQNLLKAADKLDCERGNARKAWSALRALGAVVRKGMPESYVPTEADVYDWVHQVKKDALQKVWGQYHTSLNGLYGNLQDLLSKLDPP